MPDRATTAQRNLLEVLLKRRGLLGRNSRTSDCTTTQWRPIFRACGMQEPGDPFSWPSVADWLSRLDTMQASRAIDYLQAEA